MVRLFALSVGICWRACTYRKGHVRASAILSMLSIRMDAQYKRAHHCSEREAVGYILQVVRACVQKEELVDIHAPGQRM